MYVNKIKVIDYDILWFKRRFVGIIIFIIIYKLIINYINLQIKKVLIRL